MADIHRDLGEHGARLDALERQLEQMDAKLGAMAKDMAAVRATLEQAKGGWKALVAVGSVSAALGAAVAKALLYFGHKS